MSTRLLAHGAGPAAIAVVALVSGCSAGTEDLRRQNEELRSIIIATRTDLDEVRRDQDQLRATVEQLQHKGARAAAPAAVPPKQTQQSWPADPWSAPDPFAATGAPRDLNSLEPGQAVSPTGEPVAMPDAATAMQPLTGAPPVPAVPAPQSGAVPLGPDSVSPPAAAALPLGVPPQAAVAAPAHPLPGASAPVVAAPPAAGQEIVASVRGSGTGAEPLAASATPPPNVPDSLRGTLYDDGVRAYNEGRFDDAIQTFRDFVNQQPQSAYADDAQFFIAESNVRKGQYNNAIKEFNQVVLRYGSGDRSAAALLKLAEVFSKMGDQVDARLSLQKLVNRYPGSAEAGQAYKMLQEMGG